MRNQIFTFAMYHARFPQPVSDGWQKVIPDFEPYAASEGLKIAVRRLLHWSKSPMQVGTVHNLPPAMQPPQVRKVHC